VCVSVRGGTAGGTFSLHMPHIHATLEHCCVSSSAVVVLGSTEEEHQAHLQRTLLY
jgi:hypothetical protein